MKTLWAAAFAVSLGVVLVLATGACGSGTGGGGTVFDEFLGCYFYQLWSGDLTGPMNLAQWGLMNGDGMGMQTGGSVGFNANGTVMGPLPILAFPYTIAPGRRISLMPPGGVLEGGIAADGSVAIVGLVTATENPAIAVLGRKGSGYSLASLQGDYHLGAFFWNGTNEFGWWGTFQSDGAGNIMIDEGTNMNGTITAPTGFSGAGTYTVAADGSMTWNLGIVSLDGGIMAGGELVVLAGNTLATNLQLILVLIRKGVGLNASTFSGSYHYARLGAGNTPPPRYSSFTGVSTADGVTMWNLGATTGNVDGAVMFAPALGSIGYTVAGDGLLSLPTADLVGGISQSGNVAMIAGATANNTDPQLFILIR